MAKEWTFDEAYFRIRYPQFDDFDSATLEVVFEEAATFVGNPGRCRLSDGWQKQAIYALMCHLLEMAIRSKDSGGDGSGPMSSASEGTVSIGYGIPALNRKSWLTETDCGRKFAWIMALVTYGGRIYTPPYHHPWG